MTLSARTRGDPGHASRTHSAAGTSSADTNRSLATVFASSSRNRLLHCFTVYKVCDSEQIMACPTLYTTMNSTRIWKLSSQAACQAHACCGNTTAPELLWLLWSRLLSVNHITSLGFVDVGLNATSGIWLPLARPKHIQQKRCVIAKQSDQRKVKLVACCSIWRKNGPNRFSILLLTKLQRKQYIS